MDGASKKWRPGENRNAIWSKNLNPLNDNSSRTASRRLTRALTLLHRASRQLESASQSVPDRYNKAHLFNLSVGLREICIPLYRAASRLERGEQ